MKEKYRGWNCDLPQDLGYVITTTRVLFGPMVFSEDAYNERRESVRLYRCTSWFDRNKTVGYIETRQNPSKFLIKIWGEGKSLERICKKLEKKLGLKSKNEEV